MSERRARAPERALTRSVRPGRQVGRARSACASRTPAPGNLESRLSPRCSVTGGRRLDPLRATVRSTYAPCIAAGGIGLRFDPRSRERHDRQPRFHGPGAGRLSPQAPLAAKCRLSPEARPAFVVQRPPESGHEHERTRASPQPDLLGHLLSWPRCPAGWRLRRRSRDATTQPGSRRIELRTPGDPLARIVRGRGPHHPISREEDRTPPHPRCLPSMSRPTVGSSAEASPLAAESPSRRTGPPPGTQVIHNLSPRCGQRLRL
jgi:hypothetical protein